MSIVVTAPESTQADGFKVFLAGAIDMGDAPNWQATAIELLSSYSCMIIFNPRRPKFTEDTVDEQIRWELKALDVSNIVMMWYPATSKAPISLLETGLYMRSGKLVVGAERGYFRRRNLELTTEFYSVPLQETLKEVTDDVVRRYYNSRLIPCSEDIP